MEDCVDFLNWNICYGSSYNTRGYAGGVGGEKDAALLLNSIMMGKTFIRCLSNSCRPPLPVSYKTHPSHSNSVRGKHGLYVGTGFRGGLKLN